MQKPLVLKFALGLAVSGGLVACGGGGGGSSSPTPVTTTAPPPVTTPTTTTRSSAPVISSAPEAEVMEGETASFYTLVASDPDGDPVTLRLINNNDAQAFRFDASTGQLTPFGALDYETPLDENEDNIYELTFEASDNNGETTEFTLTVSAGDIRDAFQFGLNPGVAPGENFDLLDWRLDFPLNEDGELTGRQDAPSERELDAGFEHPIYFRTGADGGLVMRAPVIGATTSENANFTRTEFREMLRRGDTSINTTRSDDRPNLNNWAFSSQPALAQGLAGAVDGELRVTMAVNEVTTTGRNNQIGRTIIGQIHASDDEPLRLYYRKLPGNTHGSIYACHEISGGEDITFNIIGSSDNDQSNPENGFLLGEIFTYQIIARGNFIDVIITQDGEVLGELTIDQTESGYDIDTDFMYFKAGNYHVNNTADVDEYAELTIYELQNMHEGFDFE